MTDEERLYAVTYAMDEWWRRHAITAAQCVSRVRAILDPAPSVEWDDGDEAWHDGWNFCVAPRTTGWMAHVWHRLRGDAQSLGLPDRAAAKARAVALYVALRGVT